MKDFQYYLVPRGFGLLSLSDILLYAVRQAQKPTAIFRQQGEQHLRHHSQFFVRVIVQ